MESKRPSWASVSPDVRAELGASSAEFGSAKYEARAF